MNLVSAVRSISESWQRAALSATGVMVATVAIVLLMSIGIGVQKDLTGQVESFGAGLIIVPGHVELGNFNPNLAGKSFLDDQCGTLVESVAGVKKVARLSFAGGSVRVKDPETKTKLSPQSPADPASANDPKKAGEREVYPFIIAASPEWFDVYHNSFEAGGPFTAANDDQPVCVLGSVAAKIVFPDKSALGQTVTINEHDYKVVGIVADKKAENSLFSIQSLANVTYIPFKYLRSVETGVQINRLMVQIDPSAEPKALVKDIDAKLATHLDRSHFSVLTQEDLLGLMYQLLSILATLVTGLTSIALFVGGVGVMTVMLMSVNERSKEIGVRKAVGGRRVDIFWQFLFEALIISMGGVMIGLAISGVAIVVLANTTKIKPLLTPGILGISILVSVGLGSIFGLIPAMQAAKKDPVESLRNE